MPPARQTPELSRAAGADADRELRLSGALQDVPVGIMLCDGDDRLVFCNREARAHFAGAEALMVPGTPFAEILRAHFAHGNVVDFDGEASDWIAQHLARRRQSDLEMELRGPDGRCRRIIEQRTADGGVVTVSVDVTAQKHQEEQLKGLAAEIKGRESSLAIAQKVA